MERSETIGKKKDGGSQKERRRWRRDKKGKEWIRIRVRGGGA